MKKNLLYASLFAVVGFIAMTLKHIIVYPNVYQQTFNNHSVLDVVISTVFCFIVGLFMAWALDLKKRKE